MLLQTVTAEGGRADHGYSPPLNPCNGCSVGPEAPSKDCSMLLKHAQPRDHARPGQEAFLALQLDTSRILKNTFPHASLK